MVATRRTSVRRIAAALLALGTAAACAWWDAPGEGARARRGFRRAAPVIAALERFRADSARYPGALAPLVPAYLPAAALDAAPPLEYRHQVDGYTLSFRYAGPGMNQCEYQPATRWQCHGWF